MIICICAPLTIEQICILDLMFLVHPIQKYCNKVVPLVFSWSAQLWNSVTLNSQWFPISKQILVKQRSNAEKDLADMLYHQADYWKEGFEYVKEILWKSCYQTDKDYE